MVKNRSRSINTWWVPTKTTMNYHSSSSSPGDPAGHSVFRPEEHVEKKLPPELAALCRNPKRK